MKVSIFRSLATAAVLAGSLFSTPAHAAKQYVVILADGLSPQLLPLGQGYLRKADDDPEELTALELFVTDGKPAPVGANAIPDLKGLLETAEANGYKTGIVTTSDITTVAPLFYDLQGDVTTALTAADAKYDFIAGGGRAKFADDTADKIKAAGGTYIKDTDGLDGEITGRVLALQADGDLDYAIDRDPETQSSLAELSSLAMDTLGMGDSPYVLIIHDTLIKKALDTKDSPGLAEQFREVDSITADVSARHDENEELSAAVLMNGGAAAPTFTTTSDTEKQDSLFILTQLLLSFEGAGKKLQGADSDAITAFADPEEGLYKGWKVNSTVRSQIINGTLKPEAALRASYEPVLKLDYSGAPAAPVAYTLGYESPEGFVAGLKAAVAKPAK